MPSLGVGVERLDGLGEHVGGRVAQDGEAVLAVDGDGLDDVALREDVEEVAQATVDARDDDGAVTLEEPHPPSSAPPPIARFRRR